MNEEAPAYFLYVRDLLKERSGLVVTAQKLYLLETRLLPLVHRYGYHSIDDMISTLQSSHNESLAVDIAEAMNTHESLFFRDVKPFEFFQSTIIPELLQRRAAKKSFRIWCAACSTGQEPLSLAMVLAEEAERLKGWNVEIVATDVSHSVLKKAKEGRFSQFEVQRGLPVQKLLKHFIQEGDTWKVNNDLLQKIQFKHLNLLDAPYRLGKFDMMFCRNVLIYFDLKTKSQVMTHLSKCVEDDGILFLGSSESTIGITDEFCPVRAGQGVYKLANDQPSLMEG